MLAAVYLAIQVAALTTAARTTKKLTTVKGRIIAYRPVDRVAQVISNSPNTEVFLLATEGPIQTTKPTILKINYVHFGFGDVTDDMLHNGKPLTMKVSRDPACDESYTHFVSTSRVMTTVNEKSGQRETSKPVIFTAGFNEASLAPDLNLQCYDLKDGNIKPEQK